MKKFFVSISTLNRLPRLWLLFSLIMLSGIAELFGISVLVPVVTSLLGGSLAETNMGAPFSYIPMALEALSIPLELGYVLSLTLFFMLFAFCCVHLQERFVAYSRYDFLKSLRDEASSTLLLSKWTYLNDVSTGELSNKLLVESERGAESLVALVNMISFFVQLFVYAFLAILLSWQMSLIAIGTVLLAALTSQRLINAVGKLGDKSVKANTSYNKQVVDIFKGSRLVKTFGIEELVKNRLAEFNNYTTTIQEKILINQSWMKLEIQALISFALVVILFLAIQLLMIEVSVLLIFLFIVMRITPKFYSFQGQYHSYIAHSPSLGIVDELIAESSLNQEKVKTDTFSFEGIKESIEFHNVDYRYSDSNVNAINNFSLKINAQEFIAIVGPSGAGKSTFLDLLMGLISPTKGRITIDQQDISKFELNSYRRRLGFVPQESILLDGTIEENLCLDEFYDKKIIQESLKIAQIDKFIDSLEQGIKTEVGEAGTRLSGGQKQRLSIARALIKNPSILILDEATSSLDSKSESLFQQAIESIASKYTLIVVAHRLSTINRAKKIYVLDKGELVESGSYQDLVEKKGLFSVLNKSQIIKE